MKKRRRHGLLQGQEGRGPDDGRRLRSLRRGPRTELERTSGSTPSVWRSTSEASSLVDETLKTNVPGVSTRSVTWRGISSSPIRRPTRASSAWSTSRVRDTVPSTTTNVPNCTYCHPEVASVGLTEEQAKEAGHDYEVGKLPMGGDRTSRGRSGHADGFVKIIRDKNYSEILGAHIVGPHATELIAEFVVGRHLESTVEEMEKAMHPHPTLSEGVAEAALAALGRAIHI